MHDVDEKQDELDALIAIFEAKLDSLPPEVFSDIPQAAQNIEAPAPLQFTENPLGAISGQPPPPSKNYSSLSQKWLSI